MRQAHLLIFVMLLLVGISNSGLAADVLVIRIGTGEGIVDGGDEIFCGSTCEATDVTRLILDTGDGSADEEGISCVPPCETSDDAGTVVRLRAIPDDDSIFDGWLVNGKPYEGILTLKEEGVLVAAKFTATTKQSNELKWMWYNGNNKQYLLFAVDEIAIFPKKMPEDWYAFTGEFKTTVEEIAHLFHPQAEVSELNDFCITIKSPEPVTLKELPGLLERIAQHPFLRSAGPVLYGYPGDPYTEKIPTGEMIVNYPSYYAEAQIRQIEEEYGLIRDRVRDESELRPLYIAESPWASLELANRLFESGLVEYAYPGWISAIILLN